MSNYTIEELNQADEQTFVDVLGDIYEESPWVPERTYSEQPFESGEDLQQAMKQTVEDAADETQLELLRAHPDLGENTEMTDASEEEQASAGLDQLSPELYEEFQRLNDEYTEKFGFPFIMSVRGESPETIRDTMEERIENSESKEFQTALNEVHEIARLRIEGLVTDK